MKHRDYNKEIFAYCAERALLYNPPLLKCTACSDESIFVEEHDASYRNHGMETSMMLLCIDCIMQLEEQMDEQWAEYYGSRL